MDFGTGPRGQNILHAGTCISKNFQYRNLHCITLTESLPDYRICEGIAAIPQKNLKLPSVQKLLQSTRVRDPVSLFSRQKYYRNEKKALCSRNLNCTVSGLKFNAFLTFTASLHGIEQTNLERQRRCTCRNVILHHFLTATFERINTNTE